MSRITCSIINDVDTSDSWLKLTTIFTDPTPPTLHSCSLKPHVQPGCATYELVSQSGRTAYKGKPNLHTLKRTPKLRHSPCHIHFHFSPHAVCLQIAVCLFREATDRISELVYYRLQELLGVYHRITLALIRLSTRTHYETSYFLRITNIYIISTTRYLSSISAVYLCLYKQNRCLYCVMVFSAAPDVCTLLL